MSRALEICVLTDGKPGHQNQALGLAEAIARRTPARVQLVQVAAGKLRSLAPIKTPDPQPDLFLGAGHSTHAPLLQLARRTGSPCVVLMKPSLPAGFFDLCLVPEHDLTGAPAPNIVPTKGALNRVPPVDPAQPRQGGLLLIGGPSGSHGWDEETILRCVQEIVARRGELPWRVTDSRRTPGRFLSRLSDSIPALASYPHADTGRDWLPQQLARAAEVWVTEDSVSMIYEALSSGAAVGLLPVPRKKKSPSRVARGIDRLADRGWLTRFDRWTPGQPLPHPPEILREADRAAAIVLSRFFPRRSS